MFIDPCDRGTAALAQIVTQSVREIQFASSPPTPALSLAPMALQNVAGRSIWMTVVRATYRCDRSRVCRSILVPREPCLGAMGLRGVDRARRKPSLCERSDLLHRFHRLMLDRGQGQATDVRRGDDTWVTRQGRAWHLVERAPDIERAA